MGQPAARVLDMHACPLATPGTPPIPHVGGPILKPGAINIMIGGMMVATVGSMAMCVGPPDAVAKGSATVLFCGQGAARMGDSCVHGGAITAGFAKVLIGG